MPLLATPLLATLILAPVNLPWATANAPLNNTKAIRDAASFKASLDLILDSPKIEGSTVSAIVTELDGTVIYEKNAGTRVVPASNQKLLSNAFALHVLGPDYRPSTRVWKDRARTVVDSPGDPLLSRKILLEAKEKLKLDVTLPVHVSEAYSPGVPGSWEHDDLPNKYAAQVTALTVDRGAFELWNKGGRPVLLPDSYGVRIERVQVDGQKPAVDYDPFARRVRITGDLPKEDARLDTLALPKPNEAVARILGSTMVSATSLPDRQPDLVILGSPMSAMIAACLPPSDNNIAEHLFLMAGRAAANAEKGDYPGSRDRMTEFMTRTVGVDPKDVRIYDGSGMSRHNLVTARAIAKLLSWQDTQPTRQVWRAALARPVGPGTLSSRLKGIEFEGKTGTLDLVVSLSGYVKGADGKERIASVILNHFVGNSTDARNVVDAFMRQVASGPY